MEYNPVQESQQAFVQGLKHSNEEHAHLYSDDQDYFNQAANSYEFQFKFQLVFFPHLKYKYACFEATHFNATFAA